MGNDCLDVENIKNPKEIKEIENFCHLNWITAFSLGNKKSKKD